MPQPTPYTRLTDFSDEESAAVAGRSTIRTAALDAELDAVQVTLAQTLVNLARVQRDDGELLDGVVKPHTLSSSVNALFAVGGGRPRGNWTTATLYVLGDVVAQSGITYLCAGGHTSGTFSADLSAGLWLPITSTTFDGSTVAVEVKTATGGQTVVALDNSYSVGTNALAIFVDGMFVHDFEETSATTATLSQPLLAGQQIVALIGRLVTSGVDGAQVSFTGDGAGAVARTATAKLREVPSVLDKGADATGVADSAAAFNASTAVPVLIPAGTYKTDTTPTGPAAAIVLGAAFTGSSPWDAWIPAFGVSAMEVVATGSRNAVIGVARNNLAASTLAFPTGVTGYARNDSAGNTAFGVYAEARQHATSGVVVGAELDSFNMTGTAPTNTTQPDRSIGTTQQLPNAVTIAAGGTANSWCATHYTREGSSPQRFLYGEIFDADAVLNSAIVVEAGATTGPTLPVLVKHKAASVAMQLQTVGTAAPDNAVLQVVDPAAAVVFGVRQNGRLAFTSGITQTTVGAAGGASSLPATPTGYLRFLVGSTQFVIPYYAAS